MEGVGCGSLNGRRTELSAYTGQVPTAARRHPPNFASLSSAPAPWRSPRPPPSLRAHVCRWSRNSSMENIEMASQRRIPGDSFARALARTGSSSSLRRIAWRQPLQEEGNEPGKIVGSQVGYIPLLHISRNGITTCGWWWSIRLLIFSQPCRG